MFKKVLSVLLAGSMLCGITCAVAGAEDKVDLADGLLLYYAFDKTDAVGVIDSTENMNDGMLEEDATTEEGVLKLDAAGYVTLPEALLDECEDLTIAFWVKAKSAEQWSRYVSFGNGANTYLIISPFFDLGWEMRAGDMPERAEELNLIAGSDRNKGLSMGLTQDGIHMAQSVGRSESFDLIDQWAHICVTLNGDLATFYLNGEVIGTNDKFTNNPSNLADSNLGAFDTTDNYIGYSSLGDPIPDAWYDEFRIYDRAVNAAEVAQLMKVAPGLTESVTGPAVEAPVEAKKPLVLQLDNQKASVNGEIKTMDVVPQVVEGRTLVPVRFLAESVGAEVAWDDATRTVTLTTADKKVITIVIDEAKLTVDGVEKALDVPASIIDSRTMLPLRAIVEALGQYVHWDNDNRLIVITESEATYTAEEITALAELVK